VKGKALDWLQPNMFTAEFVARPENSMCPYGKSGDVLWVREMHYSYGCWVKDGLTKTGKQKWKFKPDDSFETVRYFDDPPNKIEENSYRGTGWYKRLARFMFRKHSRIFLKVTDIHVECLHDISQEDAVAEGIKPIQSFESGTGISKRQMFENYLPMGYMEVLPIDSFKSLWIKINGQQSWDSNPWVWVISFEKTEKPT